MPDPVPMSLLQRFFVRLLPRRWARQMEAESRTWFLRCSCGFARSVWDLGGIRWKAAGRPRTYSPGKCPQCGRRSWLQLTREEGNLPGSAP